jgi:hypothetical protein
MALASTRVFIPKPTNLSIAEAMSQILLWLNSQELQPISFKFATDGRLGFDIGFRSEAEAVAAEAFHWRSFNGA